MRLNLFIRILQLDCNGIVTFVIYTMLARWQNIIKELVYSTYIKRNTSFCKIQSVRKDTGEFVC